VLALLDNGCRRSELESLLEEVVTSIAELRTVSETRYAGVLIGKRVYGLHKLIHSQPDPLRNTRLLTRLLVILGDTGERDDYIEIKKKILDRLLTLFENREHINNTNFIYNNVLGVLEENQLDDILPIERLYKIRESGVEYTGRLSSKNTPAHEHIIALQSCIQLDRILTGLSVKSHPGMNGVIEGFDRLISFLGDDFQNKIRNNTSVPVNRVTTGNNTQPEPSEKNTQEQPEPEPEQERKQEEEKSK